MNVEREPAPFVPVVITLETREELDILYQITRLNLTIPKHITHVSKTETEAFLDSLGDKLESVK